MASTKNTKPRNTDNSGVTVRIEQPRPTEHSDERDDNDDTQQQKGTAEPNQNTSTEELQKPTIYRKPRPFHKPNHYGHGQKTYATPLAANLFKRFDPRNVDEQPAEHYRYTDKRFKRDGHI